MIAFRAGGGVDTQARLIAETINAKRGWKIIPENVAGKGGANMARALKKQPSDGLTIGMTVSEGISYSALATRKSGYTPKDFTYLTTTSGTQMALFAKSSRGWKSLADVLAAAKSGKKITVGTMTPRLADANYLINKANGANMVTVMVKGGKGGLNGVVADDLDIAWGAGPQNKGVAAGDLVSLVSGEQKPLKVSPNAPLLSTFGVPYVFGAKFMFVAPKGLSNDAREALTNAIVEAVSDKNTKVNKSINKAFGGPEIIQGKKLDSLMASLAKQDQEVLDKSSQ
jgi:tripartite-type tricarboxylate transporter receptor subunit TctC